MVARSVHIRSGVGSAFGRCHIAACNAKSPPIVTVRPFINARVSRVSLLALEELIYRIVCCRMESRPPLTFQVTTCHGARDEVVVDFPYEAYDSQVLYMQSVLDALFKACGVGLVRSSAPTHSCHRVRTPCSSHPQALGKPSAFFALRLPGGCTALAKAVRLTRTTRFPPLLTRLSRARASNHLFVPNARTSEATSCPSSCASDNGVQLAQVVGELRATRYRPRLSVLGSRQQTCVHRDISELSGAAQNSACKAAVASRSCAHYRAVEPFLRSEPGIGTEALDLEDLVSLANEKGCGPCPYFLSRELAKVRCAVCLTTPHRIPRIAVC